MKKTLVALAVAAIASSASAITVYEADGSKVDFTGSIRLRLDKASEKQDGQERLHKHSNLHNNGSRFGVKMKHDIADDFYAVGRVEFRFNDEVEGKTDQFGDLYAHRAYVGFGSKQYGEVTFGRQALIGDDIAQSGFDNAYGTFDGTLTTSGKSAIRYDYKGIEGLQVGADYRFAEERNNKDGGDHNVPVGKLKNGYGAGVIYTFKPAEGQAVTLSSGYTRESYASPTNRAFHQDAYAFGAKYSINALTLAADYAGAFLKNGQYNVEGKKSFTENGKANVNWFRVGVKYDVVPEKVAVYTNYGHGVVKNKVSGQTTTKYTYDKYMLGTEYQVHKYVFTYVEGGFGTTKTQTAATTDKNKERFIAVGLNVNW